MMRIRHGLFFELHVSLFYSDRLKQKEENNDDKTRF